MKRALPLIAAIHVTFGFAGALRAAEPPTLDVWPGVAPGEEDATIEEKVLPPRGGKPVKRLTNVTRPTITVYKPPAAKDTGAAVVICPGGGYHILAMDLEGTEVAEWLNSIGVTGVLLKYRVPRRKGQPKHLAPLQDAQRAVSLVRANAHRWGIDPGRIGILGFSAGGHLAAAASTNFEKRRYASLDEIDRVSCRPDFTVLVYPAYLIDDARLAAEINVTDEAPPMFLVHAGDDGISSENSAALYLALKRRDIPAELHIYAEGGHGFGLRPTEKPCSRWPARCAAWMESRGLLEKPRHDGR